MQKNGGETVANGGNSGIIKADFTSESKEQSRTKPGSDRLAIVSEEIGTSKYVDRIKMLGESEKITDVIAYQARTTLLRRNGTPNEDMIFINPETCECKTQRKSTTPNRVIPTDAMKKMVLENLRKIIGIHNHPHSMLPSAADLKNAKRYKYGVILCHNGSIIKYSVKDDAAIESADVFLDLLQKKFDKKENMLSHLSILRELGVEMEVYYGNNS